MNEMKELLFTLTKEFYIRQVLVIVCLFLGGLLFLKFCMRKSDAVWQYLLAFPMGLSLWGLVGFLLLVTGIPYRLPFVLAVFFCVFLLFFFSEKREKDKLFSVKDIFAILFVGMLALIACSGLLSVSISNDSVYYYSVYPQMIVKYGAYRKSFDVFLTDVGQTTAIINCLPYFFGFQETFGIQHFMNFNFAGIFFLAVYETAESFLPKKQSVAAGIAAVVFLFATTPFLITVKWVLANVYFMEFLFIIFYLGEKCGKNHREWERFRWVFCFFMAMISMMRMEGGMMACMLILCLSTLAYTNREMLCFCVLPVSVMQIGYYGVLYLRLKVDPLYSFLDIKKALVMLFLLVALWLYFLFIREKRFQKLLKNPQAAILFALLLGNALLLAVNAQRYIENLVCFGKNIMLQNGWGYFGFIVIVLICLLPVKGEKLRYPDFFCIAYILLTIAVCWARSGTLRVGIGDSGNRVMMQIVPFVVYAVAVRVIHVWKEELCDSYDMSR